MQPLCAIFYENENTPFAIIDYPVRKIEMREKRPTREQWMCGMHPGHETVIADEEYFISNIKKDSAFFAWLKKAIDGQCELSKLERPFKIKMITDGNTTPEYKFNAIVIPMDCVAKCVTLRVVRETL